jgi:ABC-type arginine transport system permease subunit
VWLKIAIIALFVALLINLGGAYWFLIRDRATGRRRTWYSLGVRLVITVLLMGLLIVGLYTGQLRSNAPWDMRQTVTVE